MKRLIAALALAGSLTAQTTAPVVLQGTGIIANDRANINANFLQLYNAPAQVTSLPTSCTSQWQEVTLLNGAVSTIPVRYQNTSATSSCAWVPYGIAPGTYFDPVANTLNVAGNFNITGTPGASLIGPANFSSGLGTCVSTNAALCVVTSTNDTVHKHGGLYAALEYYGSANTASSYRTASGFIYIPPLESGNFTYNGTDSPAIMGLQEVGEFFGSGTITNLAGVSSELFDGPSATTGTKNVATAYWAGQPEPIGSGTWTNYAAFLDIGGQGPGGVGNITNRYGVYIGPLAGGATINGATVYASGTSSRWAWYSVDSPSYFGGNVQVGGGSTVVYRCSVAGAARAGTLTTVSADCGTAVDTGLRVN